MAGSVELGVLCPVPWFHLSRSAGAVNYGNTKSMTV